MGGLQEKINKGWGESRGMKEIKVFESFSSRGQNWFDLHLQLEAATVKSKGRFGIVMLAPLALSCWARGLWPSPPRHIPSRKECDSVCRAVGYLHTAPSAGNIAQV